MVTRGVLLLSMLLLALPGGARADAGLATAGLARFAGRSCLGAYEVKVETRTYAGLLVVTFRRDGLVHVGRFPGRTGISEQELAAVQAGRVATLTGFQDLGAAPVEPGPFRHGGQDWAWRTGGSHGRTDRNGALEVSTEKQVRGLRDVPIPASIPETGCRPLP